MLIGVNYPGTKAELRGCVNDVQRTYQCLVDRYGFSEDDISVLIDTDDSYTQPTGKNIRNALSRLVRSAEPGDVLFVHYSGHGTRLPAETGEDDDTGYDECIVPSDMNLITGLFDFASLFQFCFHRFGLCTVCLSGSLLILPILYWVLSLIGAFEDIYPFVFCQNICPIRSLFLGILNRL